MDFLGRFFEICCCFFINGIVAAEKTEIAIYKKYNICDSSIVIQMLSKT